MASAGIGVENADTGDLAALTEHDVAEILGIGLPGIVLAGTDWAGDGTVGDEETGAAQLPAAVLACYLEVSLAELSKVVTLAYVAVVHFVPMEVEQAGVEAMHVAQVRKAMRAHWLGSYPKALTQAAISAPDAEPVLWDLFASIDLFDVVLVAAWGLKSGQATAVPPAAADDDMVTHE